MYNCNVNQNKKEKELEGGKEREIKEHKDLERRKKI
jgi:hypothetical protein